MAAPRSVLTQPKRLCRTLEEFRDSRQLLGTETPPDAPAKLADKPVARPSISRYVQRLVKSLATGALEIGVFNHGYGAVG